MAVGSSTATGDGVVPAGDMTGLAHAYCGQGVSVQLHTYTGLDHVASLGWFDADARQFMQKRYAGVMPANGCALIGPGDPAHAAARAVAAVPGSPPPAKHRKCRKQHHKAGKRKCRRSPSPVSAPRISTAGRIAPSRSFDIGPSMERRAAPTIPLHAPRNGGGVMQAVRQVVAFGGGGFSQESGNPLLDDYVLGLTGTADPRVCFLPTASGDADHYVVRFYNAFRDRARPSHVSLFRRERGVLGHPLAPARAGPDLRRRWQPDQPARRLAGARHRLDAARGLRGRRDPLRALRRVALLVRRGGERLSRRGQSRARARLPPPLATPSTTATATGGAPSIAICSTGCRRDTPPRTAPRCASWATSWSRSSPHGPRPAPTSWSDEGARSWRRGWRPGIWARRRRPTWSRSCARPRRRLGGHAPHPRPRRPRFRPPGRQRRDLRPDRRARRVPAAEDLPAADGQRRPRGSDRPLPPVVRRARLRSGGDLAVPARREPGRPSRGAARPGRDLRGRRQHGQPGGDLAGPRPRRDPARVLARGDPDLRTERGRDGLVPGRDHQLAGGARGRRRARASRPAAPASTT